MMLLESSFYYLIIVWLIDQESSLFLRKYRLLLITTVVYNFFFVSVVDIIFPEFRFQSNKSGFLHLLAAININDSNDYFIFFTSVLLVLNRSQFTKVNIKQKTTQLFH